MSLTFLRLRTINAQRCERWHRLDSWTLSDWGVAAAGEMGEACNVIKKLNRVRDNVFGATFETATLEDLADELADTIMYIDLLAARAGIDLEDAVRRKFNAVSVANDFPERLT